MQKNCFRRAHRVSEKQMSTITERFPDWSFEFGDGAAHPHPLGAVERAICEELAIREINRACVEPQISDIGGNANRHDACGRKNVHSCNPLLSSNDVVRHSQPRPGARFCRKSALDCPEIPDAYLSVHSLYYLCPGEVMTLLHRSKQKCLVAVVHQFDHLYGSFHDNGDFVESTYEVSADDGIVVNMQVTGNFTGYHHDPCFWLRSTYYSEFVNGKNVGMAWNGDKVGDSWILRFVADIGPPRAVDTACPMPLCSSLNRNDHYGSVSGVQNFNDEGGLKPLLELIKLDGSKLRSCGSYLWITKGETRQVLLPKDFVKSLALFVVGMPRTPASLSLCINRAKKMVRTLSIPASMQLDCATYGASLAFVHSLEDEILAFNALCSTRSQRLFRALQEALKFETYLPCCYGEGIYETAQAYANDRSSLPAPTFDAAKAWPNGLPGYESQMPLKPLKRGASISNADRETAVERPQFHPIAPTFSNYIPVVPYASKNNEVVALTNRALVATPREDAALWSKVQQFTGEEFKRRFEELGIEPIDTTDYNAEFASWNERFPPEKQKKRSIAWESLKESDLVEQDFQRAAFVKRELTMKGGSDPEEFDPRAIQASTDRLAASYGPFMHQASKKLARAWNTEHNICYTSGLTAEEIGEWRSQFGDEPVTIIECDQSRYDSCQGKGCFDNGMVFYDQCGIKNHAYASKAVESMKKIRGYSGKGVKYRVPYTMTSGSDDTSVRNSVNNGTTMAVGLESFLDSRPAAFVCKRDWKMLVHGDDNLVVLRGCLSSRDARQLRLFLKSFYLELGMNAKVKVSYDWAAVEYCSSLFWPVEGGYVLGPKLGKRLPKIGFSLRKLKPAEVKGMMMGLKIEAGFVPVIDTYVKYVSGLIKEPAKHYVDQRAIYKSLATKRHKPTEATELFFFERYGFPASEARKILAEKLQGITLTSCVDYWCLDHFIAEDL